MENKMNKWLLVGFLISIPNAVYAACELATSPCSYDSRGNEYRTERNFGGGYNTYENGQLHSQTTPNLSGGYRTEYPSPSTRPTNNSHSHGISDYEDSQDDYQSDFNRR